ncbi:hypothetical protein [Streptomyces sp. AM 3-1-1]|uniref:hypothetical protein n=1 Tax=Streptomyces sp. AM 3-1-1 TaxID=3028711 RepID=UPI0023B8EF67|nr:hypothetical protein [Streptomyces sp. AM 3-1-1]WEH30120.1 hypothetical protein P0D76_23920 [Streptomyces sp. AM 3-1-1]
MRQPVRVPTDLAVLYLSGGYRVGARRAAMDPDEARRFIYRAASAGRLTNHGKRGRGGGLWDLDQLAKLADETPTRNRRGST